MLLKLLLVMVSLAAKILCDKHGSAEIMDPNSSSKEKERCVDKNQFCQFFEKDCKTKTTMRQSCEKTCGMCKTKGFDTKIDQTFPVPRTLSLIDVDYIDYWDIDRIEAEMHKFWRRFEESDTKNNKETMKKLEKRQNNYINEDMDYDYDEGDPTAEKVANLAGSNLKILLPNAITVGGVPILTRKRRDEGIYKNRDGHPHTDPTYDEDDFMGEKVATLAGSGIKLLLHNAIPVGGVPILTRNRREAGVYKDRDGRPHTTPNPVVKLVRIRRGDPSRFNGRLVDVVWTPESQNSSNDDGTPLMVQKGKVVAGPRLQYLLDSAITVDGDAML